MDRLRKMSDNLKAKTKHKLSSILSKSSDSRVDSRLDLPLRRSSMPLPTHTRTTASPTDSSGFFRTDTATANNSRHVRPRMKSTPASIATPPSVRIRRARRPTSPNGAPSQFIQSGGLSAREQRHAFEKRIATLESEKCRAELARQEIKVRDFQAEHDAEERRRKPASTRRKAGSQGQDSGSETVSGEEDEIVMRGRKNDERQS